MITQQQISMTSINNDTCDIYIVYMYSEKPVTVESCLHGDSRLCNSLISRCYDLGRSMCKISTYALVLS